MASERIRERRRAPAEAPAAPAAEAVRDTAEVARRAAADADAVGVEPAGVEVTIRTTTSRTADVVRVVATGDTPVEELMEEACNRLGLGDAGRYVLIARGEVLADGDRPIDDLVAEKQKNALEMRLVRKPEAGAAAA